MEQSELKRKLYDEIKRLDGRVDIEASKEYSGRDEIVMVCDMGGYVQRVVMGYVRARVSDVLEVEYYFENLESGERMYWESGRGNVEREKIECEEDVERVVGVVSKYVVYVTKYIAREENEALIAYMKKVYNMM